MFFVSSFWLFIFRSRLNFNVVFLVSYLSLCFILTLLHDIYLTGNLDERVSDRVLYDILIQAGRVVDLHIPRDKETDRPKGYAFVEYETEEIADYAVRLFSGLVTLFNRTLKFAVILCLPLFSSPWMCFIIYICWTPSLPG